MREAIILAVVIVAVVVMGPADSTGWGASRSPVPGTWEWRPAAQFGGSATSFSAAVAIGDTAYITTGYDATNALWQYDPVRDTWARKADFPGKPRGAAVAFSIDGKGYVGLGYGDDARYADLWEYDASGDRWTRKSSIPGGARDHSGAFVIGRAAFIVGGMTCAGNDCTDLKDVWAYEPKADRWTKKTDMPETIAAPATFVLRGKGYVGTGMVSGALSRNLWEYDPRRDNWTRRAPFPGPARFRAVGFSVDTKGYLGTGIASQNETSAVVFKDLWDYDPRTDAWTRQPDFGGSARGAAVAFVLGSRAFIGTGVDSDRQRLRDCWRVGPAK